MFKSLKEKMNDQRGLTLIELLAVIVILGIIAAIAVPAVSGLIDRTEKKASVSDGLQIINASKIYFAEHPEQLTVAKAKLDEYLDSKGITYTSVTRSGTSGTVTYTLDGHKSADYIDTDDADDTATETELLNYNP